MFLNETTCRIIRECRKFSSTKGNFVDVGAGSDFYYEFLSPYFEKVFCIEDDSSLHEKIRECSLSNVIISNLEEVSNVVFLKIYGNYFIKIKNLLEINDFPPFIFYPLASFEDDKKFIESIGYTVTYFLDGIYLASRH